MKPNGSLGMEINRRRNGYGKWTRDWKLSSWNVHTLYEKGGLNKMIEQFEKHNIDVLGLQEVRWLGNGVIEKKTTTMFYSCNKKTHSFGVGSLISNRLKPNVIDFKSLSPRIGTLRLRSKFFNISLINVHAPTEKKLMHIKEEFYDQIGKGI